MQAVVRDLKSDSIYILRGLRISRFRPPGLREIINDVPDDHFIVGVVYDDGDGQICISGKVKKGETTFDGCTREMREELFMKPKKEDRCLLKKGINNFYRFNVNDLFFSPIKVDDIDGEDTKNRVVICVHGSPIDIKKYLKGIEKQDYVNDDIVSIWASDKKSVLRHVSV